MSGGARSRPDRRSWPVRVHRLGEDFQDLLAAVGSLADLEALGELPS